MCARVWFVSGCFVVIWSALAISSSNGNGIEALFNKLSFLEDKILDIEQAARVSEAKLKAHVEAKEEHRQAKLEAEEPEANNLHANMQDKLAELERGVKANEILLRQQLEQGLQARMADLQGMLDAIERQMKTMENTLQDKLFRVMDRIMTDNMYQLKETLLGEVRKTKENGVPIAGTSNITVQSVPDAVKHEIEHNPSADESEASYRSCKDAPSNVSGRNFMLLNADTFPFEVYCEQISFGGGWIVFQHRFNGQLDFYKNWTEYSDGFGDLEGEFWLGLDYLHRITSLRPHELLVEVKDFAGNYGYALYDGFEIGSEEEQYVLKKLGKYQGTAGDSMSYNWGKKFSTADSNNGDYSDFGNCAADRQGAWWPLGPWAMADGQLTAGRQTMALFARVRGNMCST
uniref:Fibrinogen C-terminal domain-containing protein n=1 Tax=Anopheles atroparvus TaxID=41427 RepID=A0A182J9K9_ANOAO